MLAHHTALQQGPVPKSQYSKVTTTVQLPLSAVLHVTVTVTMTMVAMVTIETSLWTIHYLFNIMQCFAQHGLHLANTVCLMKPVMGKCLACVV